MAKAIKNIEKHVPSPAEEQAQAIKDLLEVTAESREALVVFLDILQELHKAGLLDILQGLLKSRHQVGVLAMKQINQPSMHRMIKSGITTFEFLSKIDPDQLQSMLDGVNRGMEKSAESMKTQKETTLWGLAKKMRDPDVSSSISTLMSFLQGMGEEWSKEQKRVH